MSTDLSIRLDALLARIDAATSLSPSDSTLASDVLDECEMLLANCQRNHLAVTRYTARMIREWSAATNTDMMLAVAAFSHDVQLASDAAFGLWQVAS